MHFKLSAEPRFPSEFLQSLRANYVNFRRGQDWLELVPRQFSSGGKERLGRISRLGSPIPEGCTGDLGRANEMRITEVRHRL